MSNYEINISRAWKDAEYLESLSEEQRSSLPENPAGIVELSDVDMEIIAGGNGGQVINITNDYGDCDISNDYADCFNF